MSITRINISRQGDNNNKNGNQNKFKILHNFAMVMSRINFYLMDMEIAYAEMNLNYFHKVESINKIGYTC